MVLVTAQQLLTYQTYVVTLFGAPEQTVMAQPQVHLGQNKQMISKVTHIQQAQRRRAVCLVDATEQAHSPAEMMQVVDHQLHLLWVAQKQGRKTSQCSIA